MWCTEPALGRRMALRRGGGASVVERMPKRPRAASTNSALSMTAPFGAAATEKRALELVVDEVGTRVAGASFGEAARAVSHFVAAATIAAGTCASCGPSIISV